LLSIEAGIAEPQAHAVMRRPQCPACGNPALAAQPQGRPFMPARRPMAAHAGWRSMPPADTVARLQPLVSPLCGVVSHLAPLTPQPGSDDGPWVFRSGFFKTPPADGAPLAAALHQVCLGKGLSAAASRASALCEAVERHAAFYQGDEACIEGPPEALDAPCILPAALTPHRPSVQTADMPRRWVPAWSLTRQARCYLPLGLCYAHAPAEDARHIGWTSNGCAAGNTLEEAVLQGLLELVERDAVARWWYARVERPAVPSGGHGTLPWPQVDQALGPGWERWLLDLTHDLGIPVAAAVAHHHASGGWAAGFGCGLSMAQACERALTELVQLVAAGKRMPTPPDEADAQRFLLPAAGIAAAPHAAIGQADIAGAIDHCVRAASAHGLETIVLDYSRPDLPLHTAKVVVPGLSHIWPGHTTDRIGRLQNPQALYV
jgi:ribosomal protein S12 methylthiotransferase accessory factor